MEFLSAIILFVIFYEKISRINNNYRITLYTLNNKEFSPNLRSPSISVMNFSDEFQ